ncbi:MAG: metallophosphoesterase [Candidatus Pacebacteria bacterium]|nr:metallophosphoesterase [Candidatus Paceibacterota bacterium]
MKIALLSDSHFGARNDNLNFNEYFYKFYENIFFPTLKERGISTCIHMGDVVDRRKYINFRIAFDFRSRFVSQFKKFGIDLHVIIGNHDTYYKNTSEINSMDELVGRDRVWIYSEPQVVEFDDTPILFMPWINANNYSTAVKFLNTPNTDLLMGHLEINGFQMHRGQYSDSGYEKELFRKFDTVLSGHFHHKSDDGQIYYLGSPYEMTWSDYDSPKGFHIFDTGTRELERIVNPYTLFEKIYYDDSESSFGDKYDMSSFKDKYVKLIVVNKKDLYGFDKFVDRLLVADAHDVKIIEDFSELDATNVSDDIVENTEDTMTLLEKYVDELDVTLDKTRLKNTMKSLYNEAQDLEF